jgi:hypothetical protein
MDVRKEGHWCRGRSWATGLGGTDLGVRLEGVARVELGRLLQLHHALGRVEVRLAAVAVVEVAGVAQQRHGVRVHGVSGAVQGHEVLEDGGEVRALDAAGRAREATLHHLREQKW